ncbi:hypothetical protein DFH11DRAFT_1502956 [Phellopilus nigrolimitatus]|nr:hypothetical protein DFH11DRAFT_1502956 [Phellopilus nigrolimitatus]
MVFGLFGRSKGAPPIPGVVEQTQLRTPSPSASTSAATGPPQEDLPHDVKRGVKRSRFSSPNPVTEPITGDIHLPPTDPSELSSLIKKVPPKTLHSYVLTHIANASPQEIASLIEFFASLTPPPKLHCVRCHKDFVEVENTDRSCLVPHDDESAEVEYVGSSKSKVAGVAGTTYETLWGCCNKVVEGDGDQGPPDGWCYEGSHTIDVKRARFRADSTAQNDKLTSCARLRCFNPDAVSEGRGRSQRAATRKSMKEASDEEEDYDMRELEREADALGVDSDAGEAANKKTSKVRKRKADASEVENAGSASPPVSASALKPKGKGKAQAMKPKPTVKPTSTLIASPSPALEQTDAIMAAPNPESETPPQPKSKKPRKPRKSAGADGGKYVPPKGEESSDFDEDEKPKRKKTKRKSTAPAM